MMLIGEIHNDGYPPSHILGDKAGWSYNNDNSVFRHTC